MKFDELEALRRFLQELNERQVSSLSKYYNSHLHTFFHRHDQKQKGRVSESSTATCVMSLFATDKWEDKNGPWYKHTDDLVRALLKADWKSAELARENAFSTAHVLEALTVLLLLSSQGVVQPSDKERIARGENKLVAELKRKGSISLKKYPPSAYLTQLAIRVLKKRERLDEVTSKRVLDWAWSEINKQLALITANSKTRDYYQLAYSTILVACLAKPDEATPDEILTMQTALKRLFDGQLDDGSWPQSRPLFHYPKVGNAHCFEYEMLSQLLNEPKLEDQLLDYLPNLRKAALALKNTAFQLGQNGLGWSSGHHPQIKGPESWSTASAFHFAHALHRLLIEAIRREIFRYLDQPYFAPRMPTDNPTEFAPGFLDCNIKSTGSPQSLRDVIFEGFVKPITKEALQVKNGRSLSPNTPMSMILFGPPGTSKTELTKHVSDYLGWPRLTIDPSYFVRQGMDKVQAEADHIFSMLAVAEQIVVLLDEFDEMVRDRQQANNDALSRFLTTGMLPKLASINKNRRIVFIVATNYIGHFDLAISRRGRFDRILQVMPPTAEAKLKKWDRVANKLRQLNVSATGKIKKQIEALTYDEFAEMAPDLENAQNNKSALNHIEYAYKKCTLLNKEEKSTWEKACKDQEKKIRIH